MDIVTRSLHGQFCGILDLAAQIGIEIRLLLWKNYSSCMDYRNKNGHQKAIGRGKCTASQEEDMRGLLLNTQRSYLECSKVLFIDQKIWPHYQEIIEQDVTQTFNSPRHECSHQVSRYNVEIIREKFPEDVWHY